MTLDVDSNNYQKACEAFRGKNDVTQTPSERRYQLTISDNPKFVWYRNAKVGTRTTLAFLTCANVEFTLKEGRDCYYSPALYRDYFKFAFVRNPWDRLVSTWKSKVLTRKLRRVDPSQLDRMQTFEHFADYCATLDLEVCNCHIRAQSSLIDLNNIDYLGRFERFENDLIEVAGFLNLRDCRIPRLNTSSDNRPYQEYYTDRTRKLVGELYRRDVQIFSYTFDDPMGPHSENEN